MPRKKKKMGAPRGPRRKGAPPPPTADLETLMQKLPRVPAGQSMATEWALQQCRYLYCMSVTKVTIRDLSEHPRFHGHVNFQTLEDRCTSEGWVEERRKVAEQWRVAVIEQTGRQLIEARQTWIRDLDSLAGYIFKRLVPDKKGNFEIEAQSYESMAQAFVKVVGLIDHLVQNSLDDILPTVQTTVAVATEKSETALKPDLIPEEARTAAHAILKFRLDRQRQLAAQHAAKQGPTGG